MANVLFKKGLQNNVPVASGAVDGTFYLTTDTRRLYVGTEGGKAVPLCETVQIVANVASLPKTDDIIKGDFYYATAENILCIHNGTEWVQINPDTNTNSYLASVTQTVKAPTAEELVEILNVYQMGGDSQATYNTTFSLKAGNGVDLGVSGSVITVSATTYDLEASVTNTKRAEIKLKGSDSTTDTVILTGENVAFKAGDEGNEIIISADKQVDTKYTLDVTAAAEGYNVVLTGTDGSTDSNELNPEFQVKDEKGAATSGVKIENGVAVLDTYSTGAIDKLLAGLNAMTYKGTIGKDGSTTTKPATPKAGDTYMVATAGAIVSGSKVGDLVIATGTEVNGVIPEADVTWELIPSANDTDTLVQLEKITNGVKLKETNGNGGDKGTLTFANGTKTQAVVSGSGTSTSVKFDHTGSAATQATGTAQTQVPNKSLAVNVVTGVEEDGLGHVTKVTTTPVTFKDTDTKVGTFTTTLTDGTQEATVAHNIQLVDADGGNVGSAITTSYKIKSLNDNLKVDVANNQVEMNFVWGSF